MTSTPSPVSEERESPVRGISTENLGLGYPSLSVAEGLEVTFPAGGFTAVIGPNGCGKSTLLRTIARILRPRVGRVLLNGDDLSRLRPRQLAARLGLLPQGALVPDGITVVDLVARGRQPHLSPLRQWSRSDDEAVRSALEATHTADLAGRRVEELSGGQRQRVWVAMLLAQQTPWLLLDEPTTYLDIGHQYELLDLFARLNAAGTSVVAVLHDLNQAARYASHMVVMHRGRVHASGPPERVLTAELVEEVFALKCRVSPDPETGTPMVIPRCNSRPPVEG